MSNRMAEYADYANLVRAANQPRPANWVEPRLVVNKLTSKLRSTVSSATFFADVSYYQQVVDKTYPYNVFSYRLDSGGSTDSNAEANHTVVGDWDQIKLELGYLVFRPGQSQNIMNRVKSLFGSNCPPKMAFRIDMESGAWFAGPGNHSTEANAFANMLADYVGDERRVDGYANNPDWAALWPQRPSWLKKATAAYSTNDPGPYSWQYAGGDPRWPSPVGYPRSCAPFGAYVDMNVIKLPLAQVLEDYGLAPNDPLEEIMSYYSSRSDYEAALRAIVRDEVQKAAHQVNVRTGNWFRGVFTGQDSDIEVNNAVHPGLVNNKGGVMAALVKLLSNTAPAQPAKRTTAPQEEK